MQDSRMPSDKIIWIVVGVVALIAILIVVAVVAGGQKKTPATSSSSTTTTEQAAETAPEIAAQPAPKPAENVTGQAVECGNLHITAASWKSSPGDEFSTPETGNQFIVIDLDIVNNGSESEDISTGAEMSIKTVAGYSYNQAAYFPEPSYPDGTIQAGDRARGYVAFEVPTQTTDMSFVFDPLTSDAVKIRLQ